MTTTSAEGGRRGWQGVRFEAAFAVLNFVRSAIGLPPYGVDAGTVFSDAHAASAGLQFRPQSEGAVDDLVVLRGQARAVAYQLKSGLGRLPKTATSQSETVAALEQAGRELRSADGAQLVVLVFSQLSSPLRVIARWLEGDDGLKLAPTVLKTLGDILGFDTGADWPTLRGRLRLVEVGSTAEVGARIDLGLATAFASPADRLTAADALRELVAVHSDTSGASLPPIDAARVASCLTSRGLPAISAAERNGQSVSILSRLTARYLQAVERARGALPEIPRDALVDDVKTALNRVDVVLIGGGGTGKTEVEAQIVRRHVGDGWVPILLRREDLGRSADDIPRVVGAGGRTDLADLVTQLLASASHEKVLVVIDGLDEIRRTTHASAASASGALLDVVDRLRTVEAAHDRLHILLSCRRFDWGRIAGAGWAGHFTPIDIPAISTAELAAVEAAEAGEFHGFVDSLTQTARRIAQSRPILLRMAYELWLQRQVTHGTQEARKLSDITSDVGLWLKYYAECICAADVGLVSALTQGEVMKCHDDMARALIAGEHFSLSVPRIPLEASNPKAYPWIRGVEVAVPSGDEATALEVRFFHPSYSDFALALALSQDATIRTHFAHSEALSVPLHPVWRRVPALWGSTTRSAELIGPLLADPAAPYVTKRALLEGWFDSLPTDSDVRLVGPMLLVPGGTQILADFMELATSRVERLGHDAAASWPESLAIRAADLDSARLDDLLRDLVRMIDAEGPELLRVAANAVAAEGFRRAAAESTSDQGLQNARVLARHAAELISRVLTETTIPGLPIQASDWDAAGNAARSTAIAAEVRQVLVDDEAIERMHAIGLEPTLIFLARVLGAMPSISEGTLALGHHQQTSAVNMTMRLGDLWSSSWYSLERLMPKLLKLNKQYLNLSVLAWRYVGLMWNSGHPDRGEFPLRVDGDHWHHDSSYWWWDDDHLTGAAHARIAQAGFEHVDEALRDGDAEPFLLLCALAEETKWAGLAAIALKAAHRHLETVDAPNAAVVAEAAALLITRPRTLFVSEVRPSALAALPFVAAKVDSSTQQSLWAALAGLVDLGRIAAEPIVAPDLEKLRIEHADAIKRQEDALAEVPDTPENYFERSGHAAQIQFLQAMTPEMMFAQSNRYYEQQCASQEAAARAEIPWHHPSVENFLAGMEEFAKHHQLDLVPPELARIHAEGLEALGVSGMPTNHEAVRHSGFRPAPRSPKEASAPRAQFCEEVDKLHSTHLNRRTDWTEEESEQLLRLVEEHRDRVGIDEDSPVDGQRWNPDDPNWSAQQPMPKKAWARLVSLYLQHLPEGATVKLSAASEAALLRLAHDRDPQSTSPASSALPYDVRGEAVNALLFLRSKERNLDGLIDCVLAARTDQSPSVRQSLYWRAHLLRGRADDAFAKIQSTFASQEMDKYLVELGTHSLLYPGPRDNERDAWDTSCATLLRRCLPGATTPLPAEKSGIDRMVAIRLGGMAFYLAVRRLEQTEKAVQNLVATPATLAANAELGPAFVRAALEVLEDGDDPVRVFTLLSGYVGRAQAGSATADDIPVTPEFRSELQLMTEIASELAATLVSEKAAMPLVHEDLSTVPRQERLSATVRAVESNIRTLWRGIVDPWIKSPWCLALQRLLSDALRVARDVAAAEPAEAAQMLDVWSLADRIGSLESAVKGELVELIRVLNPGGQYRRWLLPLLHRLAETGHSGALALIAQVADEARKA